MVNLMYHMMEWLDGEKGPRIIPYKTAERFKLWLLTYL